MATIGRPALFIFNLDANTFANDLLTEEVLLNPMRIQKTLLTARATYTGDGSDLPGYSVQSDRSLLHDIRCFNCWLM